MLRRFLPLTLAVLMSGCATYSDYGYYESDGYAGGDYYYDDTPAYASSVIYSDPYWGSSFGYSGWWNNHYHNPYYDPYYHVGVIDYSRNYFGFGWSIGYPWYGSGRYASPYWYRSWYSPHYGYNPYYSYNPWYGNHGYSSHHDRYWNDNRRERFGRQYHPGDVPRGGNASEQAERLARRQGLGQGQWGNPQQDQPLQQQGTMGGAVDAHRANGFGAGDWRGQNAANPRQSGWIGPAPGSTPMNPEHDVRYGTRARQFERDNPAANQADYHRRVYQQGNTGNTETWRNNRVTESDWRRADAARETALQQQQQQTEIQQRSFDREQAYERARADQARNRLMMERTNPAWNNNPGRAPVSDSNATLRRYEQPGYEQAQPQRMEQRRFEQQRFEQPRFEQPRNEQPRFEQPRQEAPRFERSEPRQESRSEGGERARMFDRDER